MVLTRGSEESEDIVLVEKRLKELMYRYSIQFAKKKMNAVQEKREVITKLENLTELLKCLQENPGVFIMKLGADWCGPCKRIEGLVKSCMDQAPPNVQCAVIDVDESLEVYSFLKKKRIVNGIPAILCYEKGNLSYIPNDVVVGANSEELNIFFKECFDKANELL
jgi:thiol:disulfide interchange protein